ncbi:MAG: TetR/AcrR family transcriptional regulator [Alphaproteobacteria bacterium]|nr:TetR/AcrR family transcriptional regulator [Alphaproteobacteria bacterium]
MRKSTAAPRRKPKQSRALATRAAIFEAAAQILEREGEAHFNTNRIAERAGVSVGTLYQYFPDKNAILVQMARAEMAALEADGAKRHPDPLRRSLRRLIHAFDGRPATRRAAVKAVVAHESAQTLGRSIDLTASFLPRIDGATRLDTFVASRAVVGAVRAAVLEGHPDLYTQAFEDAVVNLVNAYTKTLRRRRKAS